MWAFLCIIYVSMPNLDMPTQQNTHNLHYVTHAFYVGMPMYIIYIYIYIRRHPTRGMPMYNLPIIYIVCFALGLPRRQD